MTPRVTRLTWFCGLYLASVASVALIAAAVRLALRFIL
jgi:hypothetical protein